MEAAVGQPRGFDRLKASGGVSFRAWGAFFSVLDGPVESVSWSWGRIVVTRMTAALEGGGYQAGRTKLTVPILPTPDRQQRSAHAMPPRRGRHLPVADKTLLDDPELVLFRPLSTANAIGRGENFDLRAVNEIGHKVGFIIGS